MKKILIILFILLFKNNIFADDKINLGLEVYNNKAMCGTCHTLKDAKSDGEICLNRS